MNNFLVILAYGLFCQLGGAVVMYLHMGGTFGP